MELLEAGPVDGGFWMRSSARMAKLIHCGRGSRCYETEPVATDLMMTAEPSQRESRVELVLPYCERMEINIRGANALRRSKKPLVASDPREIHPAGDFYRLRGSQWDCPMART